MLDEDIMYRTYSSNWFNRHDEVRLLLLVGDLDMFECVAGYGRRPPVLMGGDSR